MNKIKNILILLLSAIMALSGSAVTVFAAQDLSATMTVYVTDNGGTPGVNHTFVLSDGSNSAKVESYGGVATITMNLPANQDVKTYILYEEQTNPDSWDYDTTVYGITLVASYDHDSLDSINITKDGVESDGNIYFNNAIKTASTASNEAADNNQATTANNAQKTENGTETANQTATTEETDENSNLNYIPDPTLYEREKMLYGTVVALDTESVSVKEENGDIVVLNLSDVKQATNYRVNDEVIIAFDGESVETGENVVVGQDIKVKITADSGLTEEEEVEEEKYNTPEPTKEEIEEAQKEKELETEIQKEKPSRWYLWLIPIAIALGACFIALHLATKREKKLDREFQEQSKELTALKSLIQEEKPNQDFPYQSLDKMLEDDDEVDDDHDSSNSTPNFIDAD